MMIRLVFLLITLPSLSGLYAQENKLSGYIKAENLPVAFAIVILEPSNVSTVSDSLGLFKISNIAAGNYKMKVMATGYNVYYQAITLANGEHREINCILKPEKTLNEVVITGVTHATDIRENPVAMSVIGPKAIQQSTESNIIDALVKNAPGLSAVKTGPNISKPFIRGLGYNRVLTLYDGIRQEGQQWGDEHGIEVDEYSIHRAEIIKGPASLMYGSDALAVVVSLIPYLPNEQDKRLHGKFVSEYQSNNGLAGGGLQLSYDDKHWLSVLRGAYRVAKNYRNNIDGRVYNTGFRETNMSWLLGYKTEKGFSQINVSLYDNLQGIPDGSRDSATRQFTYQIEEGSNDDVTNRPIASSSMLNSYSLSPLHQHIQHYRLYANNHYRAGEGDVDFTLALQQNVRREYNHPTEPRLAGLYVRLNTLNYGFRYNAPAFANIETSIGVNGMLQDNKSIQATDFPIPDYQSVDGGLYLYLKWRRQRWTLGGGVRYDMRYLKWGDFYAGTQPQTGFGIRANVDDAGAVLQFPSFNKLYSGIAASLGATYTVSQQFSFKANIGRGYRVPNITELASNGLDPGAHIIYRGNRDFKPEFSLQEDVGAQWQTKDVHATVSIFNNHLQNYIFLSLLTDGSNNPIVDAQGNKTYQYQQSAAQLYGMEATCSLHPQVMEGFSWNSSLAVVYGISKATQYKGEGISGEYLSLIPPARIQTSVQQEVFFKKNIISKIIPKAEVEIVAAQNRYLGLYNTETATSGYALLNMGWVTYLHSKAGNDIEIMVQVNNLLDKAYQSNLSRLKYFEYYTQSSNDRTGIYNMGRNICFKLVVPF